MKTIKENINSKEFKKLMIYTRGREDLRRNTKSNLLRTFVFLYYTGARLNELQTLKIKDVKQLLGVTTENGNISTLRFFKH